MKFKFLCLLIVFGHLYWAQNHFELKEVSENYSAAIDMATCNEKECSGKGVIHLTDKKLQKNFRLLFRIISFSALKQIRQVQKALNSVGIKIHSFLVISILTDMKILRWSIIL